MSTHLGNGCQQSLPRHPNIIWDQLAADELMASFIADGHHLPPATVKAMIRAKTPGRSILVTDATAAAAAAPGYYTIGETPIELNLLGRVAAAGSGKLAGSSLTLGQAVANVVRFSGLPIEEALAMATERPAAYLGIRPAGVVTADWNVREGKLHILAVRLRTSGD
jgi:N-acetylglucosamine-6-phosphate deacetylase